MLCFLRGDTTPTLQRAINTRSSHEIRQGTLFWRVIQRSGAR